MSLENTSLENMHLKPVTAARRFDMLFLALALTFVGIAIAGRL